MDGIDDLSGLPRYVQVARIVESEIRSGKWQPGKPAPSRQQLADRFGIARETAARAHRVLTEHGYLVSVPGIGMVITPRDRWPVSLRVNLAASAAYPAVAAVVGVALAGA